MESNTYEVTIEKGANNEWVARMGNQTATGATQGAALQALATRINGLSTQEQRTIFGSGGQATKTAG